MSIYEPLYSYHYLKRPYQLVPKSAAAVAKPRYLDKDGQWQPDWPPANASGDGLLTELPRAVELRLQHRRYGELRRLLRLPDVPAQNPAGAPPEDSNEVPQS